VASTHLNSFIGVLVLCIPVVAQAKCFTSIHEVKANDVKTRWRETTENDGKPMTISIANGVGGLVYSAKKDGKLWLSGNISVCRSGRDIEITMKDSKTTANVPMLARMGFPRTQSAHIAGNQIKLAGGAWSGTFVGQ
jgi:hypothetical protein